MRLRPPRQEAAAARRREEEKAAELRQHTIAAALTSAHTASGIGQHANAIRQVSQAMGNYPGEHSLIEELERLRRTKASLDEAAAEQVALACARAAPSVVCACHCALKNCDRATLALAMIHEHCCHASRLG